MRDLIERFTFDHEGATFRASIVLDDSGDAPWECGDFHGPVSKWTSRAKEPGELILNEEHGSKRFYDFAAACRLARTVWGIPNRAEAAEAARADYERLRAWCDDSWCYVGVVVELDDSSLTDECDYGHALWMIESDCDGYQKDVAKELADEILDELQADINNALRVA